MLWGLPPDRLCSCPANAHGAPDGTWTTNNGDSESWDCRWRLAVPSGPLTGTQNLTLLLRKSATGGNGNPTVDIELWNDGSLVRTLLSAE